MIEMVYRRAFDRRNYLHRGNFILVQMLRNARILLLRGKTRGGHYRPLDRSAAKGGIRRPERPCSARRWRFSFEGLRFAQIASEPVKM